MANFTPREQLMLELINRARMDPKGEAARDHIGLNEGIAKKAMILSAPKGVLAGNDELGKAADKHTGWMSQSHGFSYDEKPGTPGFYAKTPDGRVKKAGYDALFHNEILNYVPADDLTKSIIDMHHNMFVDKGVDGRGHRVAMLIDGYREIGIGHGAGLLGGYPVALLTEDFGVRAQTVFITGAVYNDKVVNDDFFTVGEQTAGRTISGGTDVTDKTGAGGGYELTYDSTGIKTVTFDLAKADLTVELIVGQTNVKLDAVNGNEIWTNATALLSTSEAIKELHALGIAEVALTGSATSEKIFGNSAANALRGQGGDDVITGGKGNDTIDGGAGRDTMDGGAGTDKFVFAAAAESASGAPDVIQGFGDAGADSIDLTLLGHVVFKGEAAFDGADEVNLTKTGSDVIVHINLDADLSTDEMQIVLKDTTLQSITADDFIV